MSDDIVRRLLAVPYVGDRDPICDLCMDAAFEIKRLRAAVVGADLALWEDVLGPIIDTAGIERTGQDGPKRVFQSVDEIRGEIERLQAENARLRSLITAWADACILMEKTGSLDTTTPEGVAAGRALIELRKAVGR